MLENGNPLRLCPDGGTGRRARLKIWFLARESEFDPRSGHHVALFLFFNELDAGFFDRRRKQKEINQRACRPQPGGSLGVGAV